MKSKQFNITSKRHSAGSNHNSYKQPMNIRKDYHTSEFQNENYYKLDNFDNPNAWDMKELDMLEGMGFQIEGDSHMGLCIPGDMDMNKYSIAKHKKLNYELKINDRKHYFKSFDNMMDKIDEFGKLDV
jgi:hypothetical protein